MWPFKYPYTNFHELNLDWILDKVKKNEEKNKEQDTEIANNAKQIVNISDEVKNFEKNSPNEIKRIIVSMVETGEIDTAFEAGYTGFVSVLDYGAKGDGVTDDTEAFKNAITYCIENNKGLYVPAVGLWNQEGGYILSETLNITYPMVLICEPNALLNWKNVSGKAVSVPSINEDGIYTYQYGFGINIDYGTYKGHKGYYRFGILQGDKTYVAPGGSVPSGQYWTAVRIGNGDLINFKASYISYWACGILLNAKSDYTGNTMINFDVMDDCATGIEFRPENNFSISVTDINFNTIGICRNGLKFTGNGIVDFLRLSGNQVWTEYPGYTTIVNDNVDINCSCISINNLNNRTTEETKKKTGSSNQWYGTLIGGVEGDFKCNHTNIEVGAWNGDMNAGSPYAFKLKGYGAIIKNTWLTTQGDFDNPIALITSEKESNFNGGIGGAIRSQMAWIKYTATETHNAGEDITLYGFSQMAVHDTVFTLIPQTACKFTFGVTNLVWQTPRKFAVTLHFTETVNSGETFKFILKNN